MTTRLGGGTLGWVAFVDAPASRWAERARGEQSRSRVDCSRALVESMRGEWSRRMLFMCRTLVSLLAVCLLALVSGRFGALGDEGKEPVKKAETPTEEIDKLIRQLGSEDFETREEATCKLTEFGSPALERLRRATKNPDAEIAVRAHVCITIIETNEKVAALVKGFKDKSAKERLHVMAAINGCHSEVKIALSSGCSSAVKIPLPTVIAAMDDPDERVREYAIRAVWNYGPLAEAAIPKLLEIAKSNKRPTNDRWFALIAFEYIGRPAEKTVPDLLELLQAKEAEVRQGAANTLGHLGKNNEKVHPALVKLLKDPDLLVQGTAAGSLGVLGQNPAATVPALLDLLKRHKGYQGDNDPRLLAFNALSAFGSGAAPAIRDLVTIVEDGNEDLFFRTRAIETIVEIGPSAKDAIPALQGLVDHSANFLLVKKAKEALEAIQEKSK
jgi:HEAT repeat protein